MRGDHRAGAAKSLALHPRYSGPLPRGQLTRAQHRDGAFDVLVRNHLFEPRRRQEAQQTDQNQWNRQGRQERQEIANREDLTSRLCRAERVGHEPVVMRLWWRAEGIAGPSAVVLSRQNGPQSTSSPRRFHQLPGCRPRRPRLRPVARGRSCAVPMRQGSHDCQRTRRSALCEFCVVSWSFVQVAFALDFPLADAVRLVPVELGQANVPVSSLLKNER